MSHHHRKKPFVTFKQIVGGTQDVLHTVTIPFRDLIGAGAGGIKTATQGVGGSLMLPLVIGGGLAVVFLISQKR